MQLQELLLELLPQTQIKSLASRTAIICDGQIFHIGSETIPKGNFARLFGRHYTVVPGESLETLEQIYEDDNAPSIAAWKQKLISSVLAGIPLAKPIAPDPPELQADPVLRYLVKELIPYLTREKDDSVRSAKGRVFDILGIKKVAGEEKPAVLDPAAEREEKVLSGDERIAYLRDMFDGQFSNLSEFIGAGRIAFRRALQDSRLLLTQGLVYRLVFQNPTEGQNYICISGCRYVPKISSKTTDSLEEHIQMALKMKYAANSLAEDKELNAKILKLNKYEENVFQKVFKNPVEEADGKSYVIPETKYGIHVQEKNIIGNIKYYIFVSTPRCAVQATDRIEDGGFITIPGVFYEMKPMRPAIPLAHESGRIVLKPLCVIQRLSNHQAFDSISKHSIFYDGLCVLEFRHYQLAGKGFKNEEDALNYFVKTGLEKGIRDILARKLYPVVVYSQGTGHGHRRIDFAGQEMLEEEARRNGLII
ncbi:MAG: hypothetical protein HYT16_01155 [DPANN group archaeon]|nr:hypothetical protein [DPANN group archaeon]